MIARGRGHHPPAFAPFFQELEAVQRAPEFEGAGGLEVFQLKKDLPAALSAE
jgi:hypothetical protein